MLRFLEPCELEIWWMTLKNNRAPLLCYLKLCASFCSHWWIQTGVTVQKRPTRVKFDNFLEPCDLEIWQMTLNRANLRDLIAVAGLVILLKLDSNHQFFSPCDLEIWWMTPKNNRTPLLYYIMLCASFQIHQWIQTGVTVRKHSMRVKMRDFFCPMWPWNFDGWPSIGHLFNATASVLHHFIAIDEFKLELHSGSAKFG